VIPYQAEMGLSVDAPFAGPLRLPLRKEGELPIPTVPSVKISEVRWERLSLDDAGGRVQLELTNRNSFPLDLSKLTYELSLAGMPVAKSSLDKPVSFGADGGTGAIDIGISFSPKELGLSAFRILTGKGSGYDFSGTLDAKTRFGPISLPLKGIGETVFRR
jgi:LEA14-like dessication related protein